MAAGGATAARLLRAEEAMAAAAARLADLDSRHAERAAGERGYLEGLRREYLLDPDVTYLNHASIGTVPRAVHEAHTELLRACEGNPWLHVWGGEWEQPREAVRRQAARLLGCDAGEVALTHNTTEGFNALAHGLPLGRGDEVLFSSLNHPGASVCWRHLAEERGFRVRSFRFPVDRVPGMGRQDVLDAYDREIAPRTRVLVFPHVDNVVGLRHPLSELCRLAHDRGVEFVAVDGAQTTGMIPLDLDGSDADFYAASPHKWLQAPKGRGLLYVRREMQASLRPMWVTWGQERWEGTVRVFEDYGTVDFPAVLALGDALEFHAAVAWSRRLDRYRRLRRVARTEARRTPGLTWRSPEEWPLSASLFAVGVDGLSSEELFSRLRRQGFVFRPFRTLGLNTVRLSPNLVTAEDEVRSFFRATARELA